MEEKLIEADRIYDVNSISFEDIDKVLKQANKEGLKYLILYYSKYDYDKYEMQIFVDYKTQTGEDASNFIIGNVFDEDIYNEFFTPKREPYNYTYKLSQSVLFEKILKICFSNSPEKYCKMPQTIDSYSISIAMKYQKNDEFLKGYTITTRDNRVGLFTLLSWDGNCHRAIVLYEHSNIVLNRLVNASLSLNELVNLLDKRIPIITRFAEYFIWRSLAYRIKKIFIRKVEY